MFTKVKTSRNSEYLQIVENYRDEGRVRQRSVLYVGPYEDLDAALAWMPKQLTQARLRATITEKTAAWVAETNFPARLREPIEKEAAAKRAEANRLGEKLEELRLLVEEHPDVLERDRARVERVERQV